jgi:hypothetical protein
MARDEKYQGETWELYKKGTPFRIDFNYLTNEMMTVEEFESGWQFLVSSYGLQDNRYMQDVFHCRDKWAKPYLSSNFYAKMSSTQWNECMHNVLKTYVSLSAPLNRFVMQYNKLIASHCEEEDFEMAHTKRFLLSFQQYNKELHLEII